MKRARCHLEREVSLYYIGSKHSLSETLRARMLEEWSDLSEWVLVDAFAGSGSFTRHVGDLFKSVVVNDLESYSRCVLTALFAPPTDLPVLNDIVPTAGYITEEYCVKRKFFTPENGMIIDGVRQSILKLPNGQTRDYAMGCLLMAADRVANTTSMYGAFLKNIKTAAQKTMLLRHPPRHAMADKVEVCQEDARVVCARASEQSLLAIDPPYTRRPYAANYIPLNVIADVENEPVLEKMAGIPVSTSWNRSVWNNYKKARIELEFLLANTKAKRAIMNYNTDGLLSENEILIIFQNAGWRCVVEHYPYVRYCAKGTAGGNEKKLFELFFIANKI